MGLALTAGGPATAEGGPHPPVRGDHLRLTVEPDDREGAADGTRDVLRDHTRAHTGGPHTGEVTRRALLLCPPVPGHPDAHPDADAACTALAKVDGRIDELPGDPSAACPMIYAPVRARATGEWDGRPVSYEAVFSNDCVLNAKTGPVFAF